MNRVTTTNNSYPGHLDMPHFISPHHHRNSSLSRVRAHIYVTHQHTHTQLNPPTLMHTNKHGARANGPLAYSHPPTPVLHQQSVVGWGEGVWRGEASGGLCESEKEREEQSVLFLIDEQLLGRTVLKAERQWERPFGAWMWASKRVRERERERDAHTQRELVV